MTSTYETTAGTEPVQNGVHEARTIQRVVTPDERFDDNHDLYMMTEIGDGVFVQWTNCRKCTKRVYDCKCVGGPQEPEYMKKWHADRFNKSFDERPDPSYELIPSLITWLEDRGYTVTKDQPAATAVPDEPPLTLEEEEEAAAREEDERIDEGVPLADPEDEAKLVDGGLNEALARVREAKATDDVGF